MGPQRLGLSTQARPLPGFNADNTLLSHDLFEGIFARAGLASDIEVSRSFPRAMTSPRRASIAGRVATELLLQERNGIAVENPRGVSWGVSELTLDGAKMPQAQLGFPLVDDGATHLAEAVLG
jgi:hypothetical protein